MGWEERTSVVATTLGDDKLLLYAMTARESLGRPFLYEVELLSTDEKIDLSALLGQPMTVALQLADYSYREFNGIVTHFSLTGELGRYVRYRAAVRPWLWLLGQGRNSRVFKAKTVPTIVKEIFREHGFSDFSESLTHGSYRTWEYLIQYNESDLNFVSRIMEQEGIYYFFKHKDGKHTLVLADSPSSHERIKGYESVPYYPPLQKERRERDHVDSWHATRQIRPGVYTARDFNFTAPKPMHVTTDQTNDHAHAAHEVYDYPGEFTVSAEGDTQAQVRLEELQADYDVVRGKGNARGLSVGSLFKLENFPRDDQNKEYLLTELTYVIRVSGYESGDQGDPPDYSVTFSAIDAHRQFRAPRATRKPRVEGPQTATVVGLKGEKNAGAEISTDNYGRVHILFHWDRLNAEAGEPSITVRVAQLWAGTGFGGVHLPRLDQEVIVEFLEGDPDRPIITGRVYNAANMPPYTLPDNMTQSGIKSRSTTKATENNFNEIRFEDKKGSEDFSMQAEKDMNTLVKHDRTTTIQRNDTLNITGDQFIKIHGNLSMIVEGVTEKSNPDKSKPVKSSLGVTGAHTIDASDSIAIQAPNKITLTCGDSVITMVPGSITLTTAGSTIAIDKNILSTSSGKSKIMLDANAFVQASGKASMLLDANVCTKSNAGDQVVMDGSVKISSPGDVSMSGVNVSSSGTATAGVGAGNSSVVASTASVDVGAPAVNVNGQGPVNIGGAMVKIG